MKKSVVMLLVSLSSCVYGSGDPDGNSQRKPFNGKVRVTRFSCGRGLFHLYSIRNDSGEVITYQNFNDNVGDPLAGQIEPGTVASLLVKRSAQNSEKQQMQRRPVVSTKEFILHFLSEQPGEKTASGLHMLQRHKSSEQKEAKVQEVVPFELFTGLEGLGGTPRITFQFDRESGHVVASSS